MVAAWGSYYDPSTYLPLSQHREKAVYTISYPTDSSNKNWNNEKNIWLVGLISGDKKRPRLYGGFLFINWLHWSIGFHGFFGLPGSVLVRGTSSLSLPPKMARWWCTVAIGEQMGGTGTCKKKCQKVAVACVYFF